MNVAEWLRRLDLAQYIEAFVENAVDEAVLPRLTADDLKDIGVAAVGHRRRLLDAIATLSEEDQWQPRKAIHMAIEATLGAERRQLSVMFCDLVGSTALSTGLIPRICARSSESTIIASPIRSPGSMAL